MAYGAEPAGRGAPAHTIYIRPSRELTARSWHWPACWHRAFEYAVAELALAAATCILGGLRLTRRLIAKQLSFEGVDFHVRRRGTSVYIEVLEFTGPVAPEPDGGCHQPRSADGLGLGLRGSGKTFHLVVFHGYMPAVPAQNVLSLGTLTIMLPDGNTKSYTLLSTDPSQVSAEQLPMTTSRNVQANPIRRIIVTNDELSWGRCLLTHIERVGAAPPIYLKPDAAEGLSYLKKAALWDWCLRMQKPLSSQLPDHYLH